MHRPYLIGLTGGIASGKNAVAAMMVRRGASLVDADIVSRDLVVPGAPLVAEIAAQWGADVLTATGALDRKVLAARVFGNPDAVRRLNALTHPAILGEMGRRADVAETGVVVFMAPLLYESGGDRMVDEVWVVTADEEVRVRRTVARDGLSAVEARARMAAQAAPSDACARADVVIENNDDLAHTEAQVEQAWRAAQARAATRGA